MKIYFFMESYKHSQKTIIFLIISVTIISSCAHVNNPWGKDALYPINKNRIFHAARTSILDYQTIVPAFSCAFFYYFKLDNKTSKWLSSETPVFGSNKNAQEASDILNDLLKYETFLTTLIVPSGDKLGDWIFYKTKGICVEYSAFCISKGATAFLKDKTNRKRPDSSDDRSFPSGHTNNAISYSTLSNRNLEYLENHYVVKYIQTFNILLAASVGYARIEGKRHYPSDVFAAFSLSYFINSFIYDAFLGRSKSNISLKFYSFGHSKSFYFSIGF